MATRPASQRSSRLRVTVGEAKVKLTRSNTRNKLRDHGRPLPTRREEDHSLKPHIQGEEKVMSRLVQTKGERTRLQQLCTLRKVLEAR